MSKLLLLIFIAVAAWWLIKRIRRNGPAQRAPDAAPERMVNCGHCGLYLPLREAVAESDRFYCCAEHRRLAN